MALRTALFFKALKKSIVEFLISSDCPRALDRYILDVLSPRNHKLLQFIHLEFLNRRRTYRGPLVSSIFDWAKFVHFELRGRIPIRRIYGLVGKTASIMLKYMRHSSSISIAYHVHMNTRGWTAE